MSFLPLVVVEMRRALHRRVTRVLVLLALVGICVLGVVAFTDSSGKTVAELHRAGTHPAVMADWWVANAGDGILMIGAIPLVVGALLGGAIFAGAEWRANTVTTALTWEPRRLRLHAARTACAFVLAVVIACVLQALFLAATLPAVLLHGTTAGTDGQWWLSLIGAVARIGLVAGGTAVLGVSLATLGRNSTFALGAVFSWMAFGEGLVRSLKPSLAHLLVGENLAITITWAPLSGGEVSRPGLVAATTLLAYLGVVVVGATSWFVRRDVTGSS